MKQIWKEVTLLQAGIGGKFILDSNPNNLERLSEVPIGFPRSERQESIIIRGRILPTTYPYNQRSFRLQIILRYDYPFKPPNVSVPDKIYHPNMDENERLCVEVIDFERSWHPSKTIASFVEAVVNLIDNPMLNKAFYPKIADEYQHNFEEFKKKALQYVLDYGTPRN